MAPLIGVREGLSRTVVRASAGSGDQADRLARFIEMFTRSAAQIVRLDTGDFAGWLIPINAAFVRVSEYLDEIDAVARSPATSAKLRVFVA